MHGSPLTRIRRFQREIFGECPECLLIMDEILKTYSSNLARNALDNKAEELPCRKFLRFQRVSCFSYGMQFAQQRILQDVGKIDVVLHSELVEPARD